MGILFSHLVCPQCPSHSTEHHQHWTSSLNWSLWNSSGCPLYRCAVAAWTTSSHVQWILLGRFVRAADKQNTEGARSRFRGVWNVLNMVLSPLKGQTFLLLTVGLWTKQGSEIFKRPLCSYKCRRTWTMWMELIWLKRGKRYGLLLMK